MSFSRRSEWPQEPNILSEILKRKKHVSGFLDLTESNPTRCGFSFLNTSRLSALSNPASAAYEPDSQGLLRAREAVCAYYAAKKIYVEPSQVVLTSSTSEAYSFLMRLLCEPGDTVGVPKPGYPLFDSLAQLNDVKLEKYSERLPASLEESAVTRPKAIVAVNPNNPTGHFVSPETREDLNFFCAKVNGALIVDEVFLDFEIGGRGRSFADNDSVLTFTLSGISKILGLPQMKLSWIVVSGPENLKTEALRRLEIIADTYLSVNAPVQNALPAWLSRHSEAVSEMATRVRDNDQLLRASIGASGGKVLPIEGGWYAALALNGISDEAFAAKLLEEDLVYVHPGYFFDYEDENTLILSLLTRPEAFEAGIDRLVKKHYNKRLK